MSMVLVVMVIVKGNDDNDHVVGDSVVVGDVCNGDRGGPKCA